jgi:hypothetical protein
MDRFETFRGIAKLVEAIEDKSQGKMGHAAVAMGRGELIGWRIQGNGGLRKDVVLGQVSVAVGRQALVDQSFFCIRNPVGRQGHRLRRGEYYLTT